MGEAQAHKFGQMIGDLLEDAIMPRLKQCAATYDLYLDSKGKRKARKGTKVTWKDSYGNKHDLDFVLERGGSEESIGEPVAFIESAWRRYTKHSRNKAQEIQGAVLPLRDTHYRSAPFIGAILAGVFTDGALTQLTSLGFEVLLFPYDTILEAFSRVGIDASFNEDTLDEHVEQKIAKWNSLTIPEKESVANAIIELNNSELETFLRKLEKTITRQIDQIKIFPLHGKIAQLPNVKDAIDYINGYDEYETVKGFARYEITVEYNNGDKIEGSFSEKENAIEFLSSYLSPADFEAVTDEQNEEDDL